MGLQDLVLCQKEILLVNKVVTSMAAAGMMVSGEQNCLSVETTRIQAIQNRCVSVVH